MNTNEIPDFTDNELWVVRSTLKERYGKEIELHMADTEVTLSGDCVINVLQVESDHMRRQKIKADETSPPPDEDAPDKPDTKPLFWGD